MLCLGRSIGGGQGWCKAHQARESCILAVTSWSPRRGPCQLPDSVSSALPPHCLYSYKLPLSQAMWYYGPASSSSGGQGQILKAANDKWRRLHRLIACPSCFRSVQQTLSRFFSTAFAGCAPGDSWSLSSLAEQSQAGLETCFAIVFVASGIVGGCRPMLFWLVQRFS